MKDVRFWQDNSWIWKRIWFRTLCKEEMNIVVELKGMLSQVHLIVDQAHGVR